MFAYLPGRETLELRGRQQELVRLLDRQHKHRVVLPKKRMIGRALVVEAEWRDKSIFLGRTIHRFNRFCGFMFVGRCGNWLSSFLNRIFRFSSSSKDNMLLRLSSRFPRRGWFPRRSMQCSLQRSLGGAVAVDGTSRDGGKRFVLLGIRLEMIKMFKYLRSILLLLPKHLLIGVT